MVTKLSSGADIEELCHNKNTFTKCCMKIIDRCLQRIMCEDERIGRYDKFRNTIIVEIDKSLFVRQKYNREALGPEQCVFRSVELNSTKCFLVTVNSRFKINLLTITKKRCYQRHIL